MQIDRVLARLQSSERLLARSLVAISDRHAQEPEVRDTARLLASWSSLHVDEMARFEKRYGSAVSEQPDRLRDALFHDPRIGGLGLLEDLHDLSLLVHQVHLCWVELKQAAQALRDETLLDACERLGHETNRQAAWLRTQLRMHAAQPLAVPSLALRQLRVSVPRPSAAGVPDLAWGPVAALVAVLLVGLAGAVLAQPWLVPSLGATVWIVAAEPAHPSARAYNIVLGHLIGLGAGIAAVLVFGAGDDPRPLLGEGVSFMRMLASAVGLGVAVALALPLRAASPAVGATVLLVTLGVLDTTSEAIGLIVGAVLIAGLGLLLRMARSGRFRLAREEQKPRRLDSRGVPALRPS